MKKKSDRHFKWQGTIANEFSTHLRWHDYISIMLHNFPFLLVRRYDWYSSKGSTYCVDILGFQVYQKITDHEW